MATTRTLKHLIDESEKSKISHFLTHHVLFCSILLDYLGPGLTQRFACYIVGYISTWHSTKSIEPHSSRSQLSIKSRREDRTMIITCFSFSIQSLFTSPRKIWYYPLSLDWLFSGTISLKTTSSFIAIQFLHTFSRVHIRK